MSRLELTFPVLPQAIKENIAKLKGSIDASEKDTRKILISSDSFSEAKNYVAIELWRDLAESGIKTAFVDLDYTSSVLKDRYHIQSNGEEILYSTNIPNGDVVILETIVDDLKGFIDTLAERYDHVIVNAPPLDSVDDNTVITSL